MATKRTNTVISPPTTLITPINRIQRAMLTIMSSSRTRNGVRDSALSFMVTIPI